MDIWKYYDGDLKYPDIIDYFYDTDYGIVTGKQIGRAHV